MYVSIYIINYIIIYIYIYIYIYIVGVRVSIRIGATSNKWDLSMSSHSKTRPAPCARSSQHQLQSCGVSSNMAVS